MLSFLHSAELEENGQQQQEQLGHSGLGHFSRKTLTENRPPRSSISSNSGF